MQVFQVVLNVSAKLFGIDELRFYLFYIVLRFKNCILKINLVCAGWKIIIIAEQIEWSMIAWMFRSLVIKITRLSLNKENNQEYIYNFTNMFTTF